MADNALMRLFKRTKTGKEVGGRREQVEKSLESSDEAQKYKDSKTKADEDKRMRTTRDAMKEGFSKGGYVRAADGCVQRGKTKGRMV